MNWTKGQYSLFRAFLGCYLVVHFVQLIPYGTELFSNQGVLPDASTSPLIHAFPNVLALVDDPLIVAVLLVIGSLTSICLALGWKDRWAALIVWYLWACLFGRNPLISNPSIPYIGWLLLAHVCIPHSKGLQRIGTSYIPKGIYISAWIILALGYSFSGLTKIASPSWVDGSAMLEILNNPLARTNIVTELLTALPDLVLKVTTWFVLVAELCFAPLVLFRRLRPLMWLFMLLMHLGLMSVMRFGDLSFAMVLIHFFTFDPTWIPAASTIKGHELIRFDGQCGMCHGFVRFVLAEDLHARFTFAPQQQSQPTSIQLELDGRQLCGATALIHILASLGGLWRIAALVMRILPTRMVDFGYAQIAKHRLQFFGRTSNACPMVPTSFQKRFISDEA